MGPTVESALHSLRLKRWQLGMLLSLTVVNVALNTISALLTAGISMYSSLHCVGADHEAISTVEHLYGWLLITAAMTSPGGSTALLLIG